MREQIEFQKFYQRCLTEDEGVILVSLWATQGSTYQKAGARLLVNVTGETCGLISGGCLEPEIAKKALEAWQGGKTLVWRIDTTSNEDKWFGYGLGCKGIMDLVFEPIFFDSPKSQFVSNLFFASSHRKTIWHCLDLSRQVVVRAMEENGNFFAQEGCPVGVGQTEDIPGWQVMVETISPSKTITIFGSGEDVLPVAEMCAVLGWNTVVVDRKNQLENHIPSSSQIDLKEEILIP